MPLLDQIEFSGLIRNTEFGDPALTHNAMVNAFRKCGWTEASHNGRPHFCAQLLKRGPVLGIRTLAHFERAMKRGRLAQGRHDRMVLILPTEDGYVVHDPRRGELFTFRHGDPTRCGEREDWDED